jgi:hypothetical protein
MTANETLALLIQMQSEIEAIKRALARLRIHVEGDADGSGQPPAPLQAAPERH